MAFKNSSHGAKTISKGLGIKRINRRRPSKYRSRSTDLVLNWGSSTFWGNGESIGNGYPRIINNPINVGWAVNKLTCFQHLKNVNISIPEFTTDLMQAMNWLDDGSIIISRTLLNSTKGRGIYLTYPDEPLEAITEAPMYVKYVKKNSEYRVHIIGGRIVDVQQKRVRQGSEGNNFQIRNHANGWVFCREDVNPPSMVLTESMRAITSLNLDFGAVDVIYNDYYKTAYVLEINTAPGLVGTTKDIYLSELKRLMEV